MDVDLERFFDRVNHDVLMGALSKRIADGRILRLIRRYLEAGVLADGVVIERVEGTPQGGPLSPLLANVLLRSSGQRAGAARTRFRALRRRLQRVRAEQACGRADDGATRAAVRCLALAHQRSQERGSAGATAQVPRLHLLGRAERGDEASGSGQSSAEDEAARARADTAQRWCEPAAGRGEAAGVPAGWKAYFRLAETPNVFAELDKWIRRRLRAIQLKQWKRGTTIYRELRARGASKDLAARVAGNARRWWRNSAMGLHIALPNRLFDELGLPRLAA